MKKFIRCFSLFSVSVILAVVIVSLAMPPEIFARMSSRSFSSRSSFSRSYSSPRVSRAPVKANYSKPAWSNKKGGTSWSKTNKKTSSSKSNQNKGWGKVGQSKTNKVASVQKPKIPGKSKLNKKLDKATARKRSTQALKQHKKQQNQFKTPSKKIDVKSEKTRRNLAQTQRNIGYSSPRDYVDRRQHFVAQNNIQPPRYSRNMSSNYGIYDTMMLCYAMNHMDNPAYAMLFYANRHNPGMMLFMSAMHKDGDKERIRQLETRIAKMEHNGVAGQPGYVPKQMGDLVLSQEAVQAMNSNEVKQYKPKIIFGTASDSGLFYQFGQFFQRASNGKIAVRLAKTKGSMHNLELLEKGKIDACLVSQNTLLEYGIKHPDNKLTATMGTMFEEYAHLIGNQNAGLISIKDLNPKKYMVSYGKDSSMLTLMQDLSHEHHDYAAFLPSSIKGGGGRYLNEGPSSSLSSVLNKKNVVMLFFVGLNSKLLKQANKHDDELRLLHVEGFKRIKGIKDQFGNQVYETAKIPWTTYASGLHPGFLVPGSVNTIKTDAILVLSNKWGKKYGQSGMDVFNGTVRIAKSQIKKVIED